MAYPYDEEEYLGTPSQALGYERLQQGEQRLGMQEARYTQMAAQAATNQRMAALKLAAQNRVPGAADDLYSMSRGGQPGDHYPGATYHNSLMDQGRFWQGVHEDKAQRDQMNGGVQQGLYRVGSEYGFNGRPIGRLDAADQDAQFDGLQQQFGAMRSQQVAGEHQRVQGTYQRAAAQEAARQNMVKKQKDQKDWFGMFESNYGRKAGEIFPHYNPKTGVANIPGRYVMGRDEDGNPAPIQQPAQAINIPLPLWNEWRKHNAGLAGLESADEMDAADPMTHKRNELAQLEAMEAAEKAPPNWANVRQRTADMETYESVFGEDPLKVLERTKQKRLMAQQAAAQASARKRTQASNDFNDYGRQVRAATGMP